MGGGREAEQGSLRGSIFRVGPGCSAGGSQSQQTGPSPSLLALLRPQCILGFGTAMWGRACPQLGLRESGQGGPCSPSWSPRTGCTACALCSKAGARCAALKRILILTAPGATVTPPPEGANSQLDQSSHLSLVTTHLENCPFPGPQEGPCRVPQLHTETYTG